ncbi:hypothetical protein PV682_40895 [Streptomyces niveiscabiei]|uniref:hypothetical protein n=1 Tax=Streptomyces niveiscabiei TaxID=164115 RepID=UPI0029A6FA70|nr:hypothetical protein [Streptomyces niveiscabiei]MDX3387758.1 hypothetical protein [Streptomyces niveiscabiei]
MTALITPTPPPPTAPNPRTPALRHAAPALAAYLAVRLISLAFLTTWAHRRHHGVRPILSQEWDAKWYWGIATHGYTHTLGTAYDANNLAFFPLYPYLVKTLSAITHLSLPSTGLAVALASSLLAAWGIFAIGDHLHDRRTGILLTVLWAAWPVALVQWMAYTESLFTALAAWSLYATLTQRWLPAAALASLAGLTRPTGIAVAAAVSAAALLSLRHHRSYKAALAVAVAPLGWCAYVTWVGLRLHRWDGYFAVQRLWHNEWTGGHETLRRFRELLGQDSTPELFLIGVTLTLITATALYALSVWDRQPVPLLIFTGAILAIVLGSGGVYFPRARFLLPAFPLLLPIAVHLTKASRRLRWLTLGTAVMASAYFSAYMALVWPSAP